MNMKYERPIINVLSIAKDDILSFSDEQDVEFEGLAGNGSGIGTVVDFSDIVKIKAR